ncbi:hypothetical protein DUNSADRAFT_11163 [Dunaliella salina]|uniref:threonine--tRNA ligase n=1 Tax=Dunaliella salina TaxID=3046 RepID=A0ABQ7GE62_DUNSA|nr:hypothetical protein DUNSADRAFT_11163 [Dunaliella salina]|eukprot:KAF5832824.1 hypothetical protein DUNSADRAFT_11163 [Dunaliella salina]
MASEAKGDPFAASVQERMPYYLKRIQLFEQYAANQRARIEEARQANQEITLTLPDGKQRKAIKNVTTPQEVAKDISPGLAKKVVVAEVDGQPWDLARPLEADCAIKLYSFDDPEGRDVEIITALPKEAVITVYRVGPMVDLCTGPHLPSTSYLKACAVTNMSRAFWRADVKREGLQRVYGITFPDNKQLKEYQHRLEEAKKRDHRNVGVQQELFFFHGLSPGSCFFQPNGARIYNQLVNFIKEKYWEYEYEEVISPNIYNFDLWETSGHAAHYRENMFQIEIEKQLFGLKPMNCPGHCVMFKSRTRSYRELPMRYADFGVLHRNEYSGALSGLTRVRRFQQDDAHIFCRQDQVQSEVQGFLKMLDEVYGTFGLDYSIALSTRPESYLLHAPTVQFQSPKCSTWLTGSCLPARHASLARRQQKPTIRVTHPFLHACILQTASNSTLNLQGTGKRALLCALPLVLFHQCFAILNLQGTGKRAPLYAFLFCFAISALPSVPLPSVLCHQCLCHQCSAIADGAFYGPKIDITVYDALRRKFQCATVQLDFQLPIRFDLEYVTEVRMPMPCLFDTSVQ